jgi:omega-amidase
MNVAAIAEGDDQPSIRFIRDLARSRGIEVIGGVVTDGADGPGRNEAVGFGPDGRETVRYAKIHPFQGAESRNYAGGASIRTFECGGFRAAPFVCYDLRFPEVFRMAVCEGAELFLVIANWPEKRIHHWVSLLQARAIENQAYVAGVNRCGKDPYLKYPGRSMVIDPQGRVLAEADSNEQILIAELNAEAVATWRRAFPVLQDIRCDVKLR